MTLPAPKFKIGDSVFQAQVEQKTEALPCPDCLDTKQWEVRTPSGQAYKVSCHRCVHNFHGLPIPRVQKYAAAVRQLTIGSVRINTADPVGKQVTYMCLETGVGSGSVYQESELHESEEAAREDGGVRAAARQEELRADPQWRREMKINSLIIPMASAFQGENSVWSAWWCYRRLREDVQKLMEAGGDITEGLRGALEWEDTGRDAPPLGRLVAAAKRAAETGDLADLKAYCEKYPNYFDWAVEPARKEE